MYKNWVCVCQFKSCWFLDRLNIKTRLQFVKENCQCKYDDDDDDGSDL
mgnify:CR=1 FL=1